MKLQRNYRKMMDFSYKNIRLLISVLFILSVLLLGYIQVNAYADEDGSVPVSVYNNSQSFSVDFKQAIKWTASIEGAEGDIDDTPTKFIIRVYNSSSDTTGTEIVHEENSSNYWKNIEGSFIALPGKTYWLSVSRGFARTWEVYKSVPHEGNGNASLTYHQHNYIDKSNSLTVSGGEQKMFFMIPTPQDIQINTTVQYGGPGEFFSALNYQMQQEVASHGNPPMTLIDYKVHGIYVAYKDGTTETSLANEKYQFPSTNYKKTIKCDKEGSYYINAIGGYGVYRFPWYDLLNIVVGSTKVEFDYANGVPPVIQADPEKMFYDPEIEFSGTYRADGKLLGKTYQLDVFNSETPNGEPIYSQAGNFKSGEIWFKSGETSLGKYDFKMVIEGLTPGRKSYRLKVSDGVFWSDTITGNFKIDDVPPQAPTGEISSWFKANTRTTDSINITWGKFTDNSGLDSNIKYINGMFEDNIWQLDGETVQNPGDSLNNHTFNLLQPNRTYTLGIKAKDHLGNTTPAWYSIAGIWTQPEPTTIGVPEAYKINGVNYIDVYFAKSNASYYKIERTEVGGSTTATGWLTFAVDGELKYTDSGLKNHGTYQYRVYTANNNNPMDSEGSTNTVTIQIPNSTPVITNTNNVSPANGQVYNATDAAKIKLVAPTFTDAEGDELWYRFTVINAATGQTVTDKEVTTPYTEVTVTGQGRYKWFVTINDKYPDGIVKWDAGYQFIIDNTAPMGSFNINSLQQYTHTTQIIVNCDFSESSGDIKEMQVYNELTISEQKRSQNM